MKLSFKLISSTVALVAAGTVNATTYSGSWEVDSGTGGLTFSADALSALSASGSTVITAATIPTTIPGLPHAGAANTALYTKATGNVSLAFNTATISGDTLTSLQAANSLVNIRRTVFNDDETTTSYNIYLADFDVNLGNSTIYANLYSRTGTGALTSFGKQAIFTADVPGVVGGTGGVIQATWVVGGAITGVASGSLNGNLRMNGVAANTILSSLGLSTAANDPVATLVRTANWGTTQAAGLFRPACLSCSPVIIPDTPEPSTYAMFGVGLLAVGVTLRRRKSSAA